MPKKPARKTATRPRRKTVADLPATPVAPADETAVTGGLTTSKYIGETEKNLNRLFTSAPQQDASLLLDESDQLFGK